MRQVVGEQPGGIGYVDEILAYHFIPQNKEAPLTSKDLFRLVQIAHETHNDQLRDIVMVLLQKALHPLMYLTTNEEVRDG
jgi:hypothetical protein